MTRPQDSDYYENRTHPAWFCQGDVFRIPVAYIEGMTRLGALPIEAILNILRGEDSATANEESEVSEGEAVYPRLVSYPLTPPALSMLITPTASMRVPSTARYGHEYRSLVPLVPVQELINSDRMTQELIQRARNDDDLSNAMYLPAHLPEGIPESLAFLHLPVTVSHDLLSQAQRLIQLQSAAVHQLQRQLVRFYAGDWPAERQNFVMPMD